MERIENQIRRGAGELGPNVPARIYLRDFKTFFGQALWPQPRRRPKTLRAQAIDRPSKLQFSQPLLFLSPPGLKSKSPDFPMQVNVSESALTLARIVSPSISKSLAVALPVLIMKLQCFSDI